MTKAKKTMVTVYRREDVVPSFRLATELFRRLHLDHRKRKSPYLAAVTEAYRRLEQLEWLVNKVFSLEAARHRLDRRGPSSPITTATHGRWAANLYAKYREVEI